MEAEGSLPHSQVTTTCPSTELAIPYLHMPLPEDPA